MLNGVTVHEVLAASPRPRLEDVASRFFEGVLGQKFSGDPVKIVDDDLQALPPGE